MRTATDDDDDTAAAVAAAGSFSSIRRNNGNGNNNNNNISSSSSNHSHSSGNLTGKPKPNIAVGAGVSSSGATLSTSATSSSRRHSTGLPDSVSHFYYKHGLFISSYPTCASSIAIVAILLACYPLINIPLPGTIPTKIVLPYKGIGELIINGQQSNRSYGTSYFDGLASAPFFGGDSVRRSDGIGGLSATENVSYELPSHFPWPQAAPIFYVQQITLRAGVLPWTDEMQLMDAFRAPLYEVFKLLEIVRNHETDDENQRTLDKICLHVENVKRAQHQEQIFPEYGCLVLSPANLWTQNEQNFTKDTNILNTIFQYHNLQKSKVSTAEMVFGLPMQDTGFKRYPFKARTRIIQYAITLILKQNDKAFLQTLKDKLLRYYPPLEIRDQGTIHKKMNTDEENKDGKEPSLSTPPLYQKQRISSNRQKTTIMYIFYPGEYKIWELLPLSIAFVLVFTYVYFSVRKIDVFRSRMLLALTSVITVLGSLIMSLGLCFFFGLTISLQSKEIFPYLVILVGLENSLVITKSVVSMDETFDVKIRVAQALSKEGWHISKTLLTEITILTIGLGTFVQVIQEFCVFAIVGLLSDFMLQMLLFSTVLAMNIKRTEYTTEAKHLPKMMLSFIMGGGSGGGGTNSSHGYQQNNAAVNGRTAGDFRFFSSNGGVGGGGSFSPPPQTPFLPGGFHRSQSHPKLSFADLNGVGVNGNEHTTKRSSIALNPAGQSSSQEQRIPKRIKIVNFWARTRFFQRAFMVWMSVWICSIIYNSGYLEHIFSAAASNGSAPVEFPRSKIDSGRGAVSSFFSNVHYAFHSAAFAANGGYTMSQQRAARASSERSNGVGTDSVHGGGDGGGEDSSGGSAAPNINETDAELRRLLYPDCELNYFLSNFHWSTIMKQYNISLSGHYVTILPTIKLSQVIKPDSASLVRNPYEKVEQNFKWKALAAALDPLDFNDDDIYRESPMIMPGGTPLVPKSPMEIFFAITLCCISIFVLCYTMIVFYRCICTRNYAEWRSSWYEESSDFPQKTEQILEGVPTQIVGHKHRIECLVSDGSCIISCCLKGQIKVWDARSGENTTTINRSDMQIAQQRDDGQTLVRRMNTSPVWCLDFFDNLIAVGCANGRVELWETPTGVLKCTYQEDAKRNLGITHIHLNGDRVIVARLSGRLDFYRLESYCKGKQIDWGFTSAYRRTHVRTGSTGSLSFMLQQQQQQRCSQEQKNAKEEMKITLEGVRLAHQQPITCMELVNDMVFTGSQDHTLKVYCLNKSDIEYTLHGHCGPITCLFVDRWQPGTGGSGSQDGLLCVWDLFTGACMYNIQAHDGAVSCLACAPSYVISLGTDERICVWERFQGNLLTTINISNAYSSLLMLTPSLLVTSKLGSLIVWDVRTGEPAREVKLDFANRQLCPKIMMLACDSVVCDYGNEIRVVRFPIVADKCH